MNGSDKPLENGPASLIVFGRDDKGKPHASTFEQADAELAAKAAGLMGMQALPVESDEHHQLAAKLAKGRVFASGRAFVPFVKAAVYDRLLALYRAGGGYFAGRRGFGCPRVRSRA